jgi:hypothetical protein
MSIDGSFGRLAIVAAVLALCGACAAVVTLAVTDEPTGGRPGLEGRPDHGSWRKLPEPAGARAAGLSELSAVRLGERVVVVAGGSYLGTKRAEARVQAVVYDLRHRGWRWAPPAPQRWRTGMSVVAARGQAIVWGGATNAARPFDAHGARYDPGLGPGDGRRLGAWKQVAAAPIAARGFHSAVWTGSRMIVWGGVGWPYFPGRAQRLLGNGAAYDPARDRWRRIPAGPLRPRRGQAAVWTGSRMVVWGGEIRGRGPRTRRASDGAIYDPARRSWQKLARAPIRWLPGTQAIWTGEQMVVWTGRDVAAYRPATGTWEPNRWIHWPQPPQRDRRGGVAAWSGDELIVWGGVRGPCGDCATKDRQGRPRPATDGAALDPRSGRWRPLPPSPLAPRDRHVALGLGDGRVFVWGGCCAGSRQLASGAIYRPGPLVAADVGRELDATCGAIEASGVVVRCPSWLPAPSRRDGSPAFAVGNRDLDGTDCSYLTELHLRSGDPAHYPFHVWFGGRCRPFELRAKAGRWPARPRRTGFLGLVGTAPERPGRPPRGRLVWPRVVAATAVHGRMALVLAVEPFPRGGLHGGHYAVVWNEGGDGYAISAHMPGGDAGSDPTPRQVRQLTWAAESMRPAGPVAPSGD